MHKKFMDIATDEDNDKSMQELHEEIDDCIDEWDSSPPGDQGLHEYLGMTWKEYKAFARDTRRLGEIVERRRALNGRAILELISDTGCEDDEHDCGAGKAENE